MSEMESATDDGAALAASTKQRVRDWYTGHAYVGDNDLDGCAAMAYDLDRLVRLYDTERAARTEAEAQVAGLKGEIAVLNQLLDMRNRILEALPCPVHGPCVPYVLDWIEESKSLRNEHLTTERIGGGWQPMSILPPVARDAVDLQSWLMPFVMSFFRHSARVSPSAASSQEVERQEFYMQWIEEGIELADLINRLQHYDF